MKKARVGTQQDANQKQNRDNTKDRRGCWEQLSQGGVSRWVVDPVYDGLRLSSSFQPIFSLAHSRVVGYEGLLRARACDGASEPPLALFRCAEELSESDCLDTCAIAMHIANFTRLAAGRNHWLFVNSRPSADVWSSHSGLGLYLALFNLPANRVVVEILEHAADDLACLQDTVDSYRDLGCLLAVDDFGAGHSNFDRLWRLEPEIVKLDRAMIAKAAHSRRVARMLPKMVSLIHEMGSLVLAEGVETAEEALTVMDAGVDMVQGYYFARPAQGLADPEVIGDGVDELWRLYSGRRQMDGQRDERNRMLRELFGQAARRLQEGALLEDACCDFLMLPDAIRCYLLDSGGRQAMPNVVLRAIHADCSFHFAPLFDADGANWSRRPYFMKAMNDPGRVQLTPPYLSVNGDGQCVTLSVCTRIRGEHFVLCGDLQWDE